MILKVVVLFLVGMGVLAMFGKLKFPGKKRLDAARCSLADRSGRYPEDLGFQGTSATALRLRGLAEPRGERDSSRSERMDMMSQPTVGERNSHHEGIGLHPTREERSTTN